MSNLLDPLRPSMTPQWVEPNEPADSAVLKDLHRNSLLARILWHRGITDSATARAFLSNGPVAAPSPWDLPNMDRAADRVSLALDRHEKIAIFGDYDADGITSAVLLTRALRDHLGKDHVLTLLPERSDGYGVSVHGVEEAVQFGASLMIAADCGSSDHQALSAAREADMDVVVLDHHRISGAPPEHGIIVSPQLGGDPRYQDLSGVGVSWLFVSALAQSGVTIADPPARTERAFLDLVAIGTVADVSDMMGINRSIVRDGTAVLRQSIRPGLRAMARIAERDLRSMTTSDIAFFIAPRLNAAGRLASPRLAYELLITDDPVEAEELAMRVERINTERKALASAVLQAAVQKLLSRPDWESWPVLIASDRSWPSGLVGTIAAKLTEASGRPSILFTVGDDGVLSGSARSIPGVNIGAMLAELDHLLLRHGGHSGAAGVSLREEHLEEFSEELATLALAGEAEIPAPSLLHIDADVAPDELSLESVEALSLLEPCGRGNDTPTIRIGGAHLIDYSAMGGGDAHLKLRARHGNRQIECVFWNSSQRSGELVTARRIDLVGTLGVNMWRQRPRLQLDLKDFKLHS
jgi:single-stranded-DNA-specific exonuclease